MTAPPQRPPVRPQSQQQNQPQNQPPDSSAPNAAFPPAEDAAATAAANATAEHTRANPAAASLEGFSLFLVVPPKPTKWAKHDLIEIIINESSIQNFQQTHDLQKNYANNAALTNFPSLKDLFKNATLREGIGSSSPIAVGVTDTNTYKGQAKINRSDQITAKITAEIIDVKPNGSLVLEAKESIQTDKEISTLVMSGICRSADITKNNTIQSSQLANLNIHIDHEGEAKDTAAKGWITRVLETVFGF
jgi:flagellar L-ring protein precursor FlgH